ncbi:MAG: Rieske 2Fe-2S domain-containing protein [Magnetococcus sp. WYHC-3]
MSKALNYLAGARPDAATHLLGFYKHSVQALDDKTRHLIQIVTKVAVGTERGLRQYAPKALKAGASREEILDAVLMAFPAAGLNKVLDAIDVLLDLDLLPELPGKTAAVASNPVLAALADLPLRRKVCVKREDGEFMLFRTGESLVKVYSSRCPHSKATLCKGIDKQGRVECRVHNWEFDLETGHCVGPNPEDKPSLIEVPVRVENGQVLLAQ